MAWEKIFPSLILIPTNNLIFFFNTTQQAKYEPSVQLTKSLFVNRSEGGCNYYKVSLQS